MRSKSALADQPLKFNPVAFRASAVVEPIPTFGRPEVKVFRLRSIDRQSEIASSSLSIDEFCRRVREGARARNLGAETAADRVAGDAGDQ
jgi:hypothetical protein